MKIIKTFIKWLLLISVVIFLVIAGLWFLNAPEDLAENSQSKNKLDQADYSVGTIKIKITDLKRTTPALGGFNGEAQRSLAGTIWFPEGQSRDHPLIIYSHGFGGHHKESRHIAKYLAANGYVVAAVDFPLSNMQSPADVPQLIDVVNQPGDVSALIDHALVLNQDPDSILHQRIDPVNIGTMGLSLGGLTTALVTFHPDFKEERIKAIVMLAPPLETFSENFYASNPKVKSLVMSGSLDRVVPEPANATNVKLRQPSGWFMSLDKGTHLGFSNLGNPLRWMENPDNLGCALLDMMLSKLELPERWGAIIPDTGGVLRDIVPSPPCPELPGRAMNGLKQQWLTRIAIGSFFDMHLRSGTRAELATDFFTTELSSEQSTISLSSPL